MTAIFANAIRRATLGGMACVALGAATPALAGTELLGGGYLVSRNSACEQNGWGGVHQVLARFEPQGAWGNQPDISQMSLLFGTGTIAFTFNNNGRYRSTQVIESATYVWNGPYSPDEPTMSFSWYYYGDIPGRWDRELDQLILEFSNFNEHEGCEMIAYLSLHRN